MARVLKARSRRGTATSVAVGASWMSLLAASALGVAQLDQVRATIKADDLSDAVSYRLIVQSYSKASLDGSERPGRYARPNASTQRAVTAEELQNGIDVRMLQLDVAPDTGEAVVVAWVEQGLPDLEFDALGARPHDDAYYGAAGGDAPNIVLRRWRG
jgi:hypothetical protein